MALSKETKIAACVIAVLSASIAIGMTEWSGGHPIGSFAESFAAVAMMTSSFLAAAYVGIKVHERIEKSQRFYKLATVGAWLAGLLVAFALVALINFIPGISEALDRMPDSSE